MSHVDPVGVAPAHSKFLIVGGGAAGVSLAARLCAAGHSGNVTIVEPSDVHYYQPLWTLVAAGDADRESTKRSEASVIPPGAAWVKDAAAGFDPAQNSVNLKGGARITYDWLIVALGLQLNWGAVKGLKENMGQHGICSNYSFETVPFTWQAIRNFKGGDAVFTHPATPIKCGGAPQKIMYLADDAFRRQGVRDKAKIHFYSGEAAIFKAEHYAKALTKVVERKGLITHFKHNLTEIRAASQEAVFQDLDANKEVVQHFDLLHVTPPQGPLDVMKGSPLANAGGWVDVDKETCRHVTHPNVFALGDCSSLPTSKTGAAIRKQVMVVLKNLLASVAGKPMTEKYDGYTSCPLTTGYGKLILAEFGYDLKPHETFPFDQSKERWSMYMLKKHLLPKLYWSGMLKGRA